MIEYSCLVDFQVRSDKESDQTSLEVGEFEWVPKKRENFIVGSTGISQPSFFKERGGP